MRYEEEEDSEAEGSESDESASDENHQQTHTGYCVDVAYTYQVYIHILSLLLFTECMILEIMITYK